MIQSSASHRFIVLRVSGWFLSRIQPIVIQRTPSRLRESSRIEQTPATNADIDACRFGGARRRSLRTSRPRGPSALPAHKKAPATETARAKRVIDPDKPGGCLRLGLCDPVRCRIYTRPNREGSRFVMLVGSTHCARRRDGGGSQFLADLLAVSYPCDDAPTRADGCEDQSRRRSHPARFSS